MSDDNNQPDEKLDFNMDEFSGDGPPDAPPIPDNTTNHYEIQSPEITSETSDNKRTKKKDCLILDGNTPFTTAGGETANLCIWHKKLKPDEKVTIHCPNPDHQDNNASAWIILKENGALFWSCSSCGERGWYPDNKQSKATEKKKDKEKAPNPEETVLAIANSFYLFRDKQGNTYAETTLHGQKNVVPVMSGDFADTIRVIYLDKTKSTISSHALSNAIVNVNACVKFGKNVERVALRNHKFDDCVYINVGDDAGRVIRVDKDGYDYVDNYQGKFITTSRMKALPDIAPKGDLTLLRKHLNVNDEEFPLVYGWLLSTVAGVEPYLFLNIQGVAGSSKSVTAKVLQSLVDPSVSFSGAIKTEKDFALACTNGYLIIQDNLSKLSRAFADTLCLASGGATYEMRILYTNFDIYTIRIHNPLIITNINSVADSSDLSTRFVILDLPYIPKSKRKDETEFWEAFNADKSAIFTGILDGIVSGFKHIDSIQLDSLPRMAAAAKWNTACEQDIGMGGNFMKAYTENQDTACVDGIDASPAGMALKLFMVKRERYTGTVTKLLQELENVVGYRQTLGSNWPATPNALTATLKRLIENFKSIGIDIDRKKGSGGSRNYIITNSNYKQQSLFGSGATFSLNNFSSEETSDQIPEADRAMNKSPFLDKNEEDDSE